MDGCTGKTKHGSLILLLSLIFTCWLFMTAIAAPVQDDWVANEPNGGLVEPADTSGMEVAAIISVHEMIDEGLYKSIVRRSKEAIDQGASYLIFDIQTYGGRVDSADDISKYMIHELNPNVETVAFVTTEAISAGSMISVSCESIVMKKNTTIGCSAPIIMGGELEGVEREKSESFVRSTFAKAAQANGYPEAVLKAMVTHTLEVWQVRNLQTETFEYFEKEYLPTDPNTYDIKGKKLICKEGELLTLTDQRAKEYGVAQAIVKDYDGLMAYLSKRDNVTFADMPVEKEMLWSEEMVRFLNSPGMVSLLTLGIMLGVYVEFNTPGLGLPGLLAVVCLMVLVGSRYLDGMANWVEIALLSVGVLLILIEIFIIPGFGLTGLTGSVCVIVGLFGMLVKNPPDKLPWPDSEMSWDLFAEGVFGMTGGFVAFLIAAWAITKYLPRTKFMSGMILSPTVGGADSADDEQVVQVVSNAVLPVHVGDVGIVETPLRPAGTARFNGNLVDVVCEAGFIERAATVTVREVHGNRVVVEVLIEGK